MVVMYTLILLQFESDNKERWLINVCGNNGGYQCKQCFSSKCCQFTPFLITVIVDRPEKSHLPRAGTESRPPCLYYQKALLVTIYSSNCVSYFLILI